MEGCATPDKDHCIDLDSPISKSNQGSWLHNEKPDLEKPRRCNPSKSTTQTEQTEGGRRRRCVQIKRRKHPQHRQMSGFDPPNEHNPNLSSESDPNQDNNLKTEKPGSGKDTRNHGTAVQKVGGEEEEQGWSKLKEAEEEGWHSEGEKRNGKKEARWRE